ncbi:Eukaryotic translation initiation factor 4E type 2 [Podila epicladia]|nr:Eukaryotic translation initiation factor 4E type 2 [Podila epicladia]KAG0095351.1 Eukaryotic translation initiation factor 4E type 2 [Podila epicladia]
MDSVWNNRKQSKTDTSSTGGSKLVQLQRQSSAIGSVLTTSSSTTTTPFSSLTEQQPGLSAFLTGSGEALSTSDPSETSSSHPGNGSETQPPTGDIHPLRFNWVFWFMHRSPGSKILNYESSMKKVATFGSIEDFWGVYSHLKRPHELPNVSDYHLFKQGVRPVWEDSTNINGGKWIVRLKKGLASRYWENLIMAVIGDQFEVGSEICGIVLSIRGGEDILSIWNQSAHEGRTNLKIRDTLKRILGLPADTIMEYKTHNDALKDNTSFRNTDVFR